MKDWGLRRTGIRDERKNERKKGKKKRMKSPFGIDIRCTGSNWIARLFRTNEDSLFELTVLRKLSSFNVRQFLNIDPFN